ncbi:MAG: MerR family transcriptional regulator, partial [Roseibium sp.]|uniref:MerR family transcriptional regulator n=1 Tax=Roseibium sp. TaxID=1936156 RepID=UPI003298D89E
MQIKEAAERLGITERMLRHYEQSGLMETGRAEGGKAGVNGVAFGVEVGPKPLDLLEFAEQLRDATLTGAVTLVG